MSELILTRRDGGVCTIMLNRPAALNALTVEAMAALPTGSRTPRKIPPRGR